MDLDGVDGLSLSARTPDGVVEVRVALPGLHNDPLFDAFYHAADRLRVIHPRHEQTAAYMALGWQLVNEEGENE